MLIIIEGPDLAGKSTFVDGLRQRIDELHPESEVRLEHQGPLVMHPLAAYELSLLSHQRENAHIIADRWHLGELVYGPILRGKSAFTQAMWRHTELFLASRGAIQLTMLPPLPLLVRRLHNRGDRLISSTMLVDVWKQYSKLTSTPTPWEQAITHVRVLSSGMSAYESDWLIDLAKDAQAKVVDAGLEEFPSYIGRPRPHILLVGDTNQRRPTHRPAFTPWTQRSSRTYLLNSLPADQWRDVGIVNATDVDVPKLWNNLLRPPIVALGVLAHQQLLADGLPHGTAPHPRSAFQLDYDYQQEYGESLWEAALTKGMLQ